MGIRRSQTVITASVLAACALVARLGYAADRAAAAEPAADSAASAVGLEEIVVTARRKSELLQDVPATVTAITSAEIQKLNLQNLQDISGIVPGLQIVATGRGYDDNNTFRGVSFNPATGTQDTVAFYLNDTPVTNNFVTASNFDVGQLEVLSGPQGTLRGEPAPSGSITITTRRPDLEQFGGYATVSGAQFGAFNENGAVNLPLIKEKLAVRLAGLADINDYDGVRSVHNPADPYFHTFAGRVSARFDPIDALEANLVYQHLKWHQSSYSQQAGNGAPGGINPNAPANYNGPPIEPLQRLAVQTYPYELYDTNDIVTGQLDWHFLDQQLSYVGSWYRFALRNGDEVVAANEAPGINASNPVPTLESPFTTQNAATHELRLASQTPLFGFVDYTAGMFFRNTRNQVDPVQNPAYLPGAFGSPLGTPNPFTFNPRYPLQVVVHSPKQEKELSEFVHLTFHLPHDTELALGGRYLSYKTTGSTTVNLDPTGTFVASPLPFPCSVAGFGSTYPGTCDIPASVALAGRLTALPYTPLHLTDHPLIYNASLSRKLNQNLLLYVSSGSSWRPPASTVGIYNAADDPTLSSLLHLKSERSYEVEGGFKWTFLENRGRVNVTYYHQKFDGFIFQGIPALYLQDNGVTRSVQPFAFNSNPDAVVNGVDLDAGFKITREWSFDLSASYSNGHLTGSSIPCSPPSGGTTPAAFPPGTHVFLCPSHAATSTAPNVGFSAQSEYDVPVPGTNAINGFIRGLYNFYGRNTHISAAYVTPSYGILNLYAGLRSPGGTWEVAAFAKNALNTERVLYLGYPDTNDSSLAAGFGDSGYTQTNVTPRRQFGLTATYSVGSR